MMPPGIPWRTYRRATSAYPGLASPLFTGLPTRSVLGSWASEEIKCQKDSQCAAQQPDSDDHYRRYATDWLLALCHFTGLLPALLQDVSRNHLRGDQNADGDHHHLIQQAHARYEVGDGVYGTEYIADDQGGEDLRIPGGSRMPVR